MNNASQPSLRERLKSDDILIAPGVFEMISAKVADRKGFEALYMTGYGVVASYLGLPDAGIASYTQMLDRVAQICDGTKTPLIADADTGYGGLLNIRETVRGYEAAGAAGIQIEDQEFPKKCGHTPGKKVVPLNEMVRRIQVAVESRRHDDTLIIARTDARAVNGLDDALRRAEACAKAGADVLFVEAPTSEAEMEQICRSFDTPQLVNVADGGMTPILSRERYQEIGYSVAIYPATGFLAATQVFDTVYGALKNEGDSTSVQDLLYPFPEMSKLMGFEDVWEFDKKHAT
ncbi:MAG: isocitrate lyase/PEP mutase family protein [Alphaproteobacteria bacterium]